jgi:GTP 3',8-cyclase
MPDLIDLYGRNITYLRISVTDNCNLRCVYCMSADDDSHPEKPRLLSAAEIEKVAESAVRCGIKQVRLTGGEPLVRPDIVEIVERLARLQGLDEVSLTTNGILLEKLAAPLAKAGLKRVNVSLDTLNFEKFARITRGGSLDRVWKGIFAAEKAGLTPLKINVVVVKGLNDDELADLANLTVEKPWHIRFIELMPVRNLDSWGSGFPPYSERYLSMHEMFSRLAVLNLQPETNRHGNGPARMYQIPGASGKVGFISPIGEHFCATCNRLRLTSDGYLRSCLLLDKEVEIKEYLNSGADLVPLILKAVSLKPEGHEIASLHYPESRHMAEIGG